MPIRSSSIWQRFQARSRPTKVRTLARANPVALDSSTPPAGSLVVLAFDNMDDVKAWWNSPAYQAIIPLREKSTKTRAYADRECLRPDPSGPADDPVRAQRPPHSSAAAFASVNFCAQQQEAFMLD